MGHNLTRINCEDKVGAAVPSAPGRAHPGAATSQRSEIALRRLRIAHRKLGERTPKRERDPHALTSHLVRIAPLELVPTRLLSQVKALRPGYFWWMCLANSTWPPL